VAHVSVNQTTTVAIPGRASAKPASNTAPTAPQARPFSAHPSALALPRRLLVRISDHWLPYIVWAAQRAGRLGLTGIVLLGTALVFLISTHLPLAREVDGLRSQLASAHAQVVESPATVSDHPTALLHSLPARGQMPGLLRVVLQQADAAHLGIDTGKYEMTAQKSGGVMSYQVSFPVTGPYPQVRQFIDATLTALPAVAMSELSLTRKTIGDGAVEAQIRLVVFTRDGQ
jgi:hypothetical protein